MCAIMSVTRKLSARRAGGIGQFGFITANVGRNNPCVRTLQFLQSVQFRDDCITGTFTSCGRNSQGRHPVEWLFRYYLIYIEIPEITFVKGIPSAMALAVSMTEPPPTGSRKSIPSRRPSSIPSYTFGSVGLGCIPPSST